MIEIKSGYLVEMSHKRYGIEAYERRENSFISPSIFD